MSPTRGDLGLAAASGLVLGAAFLPAFPGVLAWIAFLPLLIALERRVAHGSPRSWFTLGYTGGAVFFLVGTHWIALLNDVALTIGWLKYVGWVAGALYLALFWGLATWLAGTLARRSGLAARWTFVPAMLLVESLRGAGDMGFPWFQPGYTQHAVLPVLQLAAWGGVTLVTAWLLCVNAAALGAWRARTPRALALAVLMLGVPIGLGAFALRARTEPAGPRIALVQGNIPGEKKWSGDHTVEIFQEFFRLSRTVADDEPALVIWPETATGTYVRRMPDQSVAVARLASELGAPVYMGFAHYTFDPDGKPVVWNAAGGWNPDGSLTEVYSKRHLVPFGERVPFQRWIPALGKWDLGQAEWRPGTGPVLFPGPDGRPMTMLICFESIFPELARADVRAGSRLLVNITNDEWFGNGAALVQHAAMAPFRAVENRVPIARCANTGLTQMIDAYG
ncbi:MAG: apolipoprotein N-acyltransferase, partial [Candidatus Eisenbacteria bacterium]|nr:apolipoprotein N-acyltransferase [Candidatus Eisenbacteria bacterium]